MIQHGLFITYLSKETICAFASPLEIIFLKIIRGDSLFIEIFILNTSGYILLFNCKE
jgi:hypothetical protein